MNDAHAYNITVRRGEFEGEVCFEARVLELPDIAEYADSAQEAYELAVDAIQTTAEVMAEKQNAMPAPADMPGEFSGRVTLRLPKTLHRSLAEMAASESVSLNQYIVSLLSYFSAFGQMRPGVEHGWKSVVQQEGRHMRSHLKLVESTDLAAKEEWRRTG